MIVVDPKAQVHSGENQYCNNIISTQSTFTNLHILVTPENGGANIYVQCIHLQIPTLYFINYMYFNCKDDYL